ncbi:ABC transporter [Mangrovactinospora gilvigrisea]|uniref:ABC transporter n=1 Tax=Mangrovactinospora gilvigrisea TaxID=1428644 RepID=A0A1J7BWD4_9ACTN|nr:ABC transporter ATP-binding protein [Mangrovactinospora gilvigrisea]OIV37769.1 ABC transporter [Mangrovactinospora gilvigrisea]
MSGGEAAVLAEGLSKEYGGGRKRVRALDTLDLTVRRGEVFGYLGPNGAGKSTTIRMLLDLLRPTSGTVRVLGEEPRSGGPGLRRRVGYLAGDFVIEPRQTVGEALRFLAELRGGVPPMRIEGLAERLDLDLKRKVRQLSKGNRQKVGVVQAFMHRPELLILDEPTSGLDPLLQQEFLALVREAREDGRTVFMSSHIMSEVQAVADRVAVIREGRLLTVDTVDSLREHAVRHVAVRLDEGPEEVDAEAFARTPGVRDLEVRPAADAAGGSELRCTLDGRADGLVKALARYGVAALELEEPDLEEVFFTLYNHNGGRETGGVTGHGA